MCAPRPVQNNPVPPPVFDPRPTTHPRLPFCGACASTHPPPPMSLIHVAHVHTRRWLWPAQLQAGRPAGTRTVLWGVHGPNKLGPPPTHAPNPTFCPDIPFSFLPLHSWPCPCRTPHPCPAPAMHGLANFQPCPPLSFAPCSPVFASLAPASPVHPPQQTLPPPRHDCTQPTSPIEHYNTSSAKLTPSPSTSIRFVGLSNMPCFPLCFPQAPHARRLTYAWHAPRSPRRAMRRLHLQHLTLSPFILGTLSLPQHSSVTPHHCLPPPVQRSCSPCSHHLSVAVPALLCQPRPPALLPMQRRPGSRTLSYGAPALVLILPESTPHTHVS